MLLSCIKYAWTRKTYGNSEIKKKIKVIALQVVKRILWVVRKTQSIEVKEGQSDFYVYYIHLQAT